MSSSSFSRCSSAAPAEARDDIIESQLNLTTLYIDTILYLNILTNSDALL
jgi:hypothetical protein